MTTFVASKCIAEVIYIIQIEHLDAALVNN